MPVRQVGTSAWHQHRVVAFQVVDIVGVSLETGHGHERNAVRQRESGSMGCTRESSVLASSILGAATSWFLSRSPRPETTIVCGRFSSSNWKGHSKVLGILTAMSARAYWSRSATRVVSDNVLRDPCQIGRRTVSPHRRDFRLDDLGSFPLRIRELEHSIVNPVFARDALARTHFLDRHTISVRAGDQAQCAFSFVFAKPTQAETKPPPGAQASASQCQAWKSPDFLTASEQPHSATSSPMSSRTMRIRSGFVAVAYEGHRVPGDFSQGGRFMGAPSDSGRENGPAAAPAALPDQQIRSSRMPFYGPYADRSASFPRFHNPSRSRYPSECRPMVNGSNRARRSRAMRAAIAVSLSA